LPRDAGSRAIILRSGLQHFSAGADLDMRAEQGRVDLASETGAWTASNIFVSWNCCRSRWSRASTNFNLFGLSWLVNLSFDSRRLRSRIGHVFALPVEPF
jgi:hypothetical protein